MEKQRKKAFTLLELLTVIVIGGIVATISIPNLVPQMRELSVERGAMQVEQAINEARSFAIKKSRNVYIDFSQANANQENNGGLVQILQENDNSILYDFSLEKNVIFKNESSTINNNRVTFDYQGQPLGPSGNASGFDDTNNIIYIGYSKIDKNVPSKKLTITPFTASVTLE